MTQVNILEAKTELSSLIRSLESGAEDSIVIARHGKPVARLIPFKEADVSRRIGIAKGRFTCPEDLDADNDTIAALFGVAP